MDYENFKEKRQNKRDNDKFTKLAVLEKVKQNINHYHTHYFNRSVLKFDTQFESLLKQYLQNKTETSIRRNYRNIANRRYSTKQMGRNFKNFQIIMDYDFPIQ